MHSQFDSAESRRDFASTGPQIHALIVKDQPVGVVQVGTWRNSSPSLSRYKAASESTSPSTM